jgi:hypothetical protein
MSIYKNNIISKVSFFPIFATIWLYDLANLLEYESFKILKKLESSFKGVQNGRDFQNGWKTEFSTITQ